MIQDDLLLSTGMAMMRYNFVYHLSMRTLMASPRMMVYSAISARWYLTVAHERTLNPWMPSMTTHLMPRTGGKSPKWTADAAFSWDVPWCSLHYSFFVQLALTRVPLGTIGGVQCLLSSPLDWRFPQWFYDPTKKATVEPGYHDSSAIREHDRSRNYKFPLQQKAFEYTNVSCLYKMNVSSMTVYVSFQIWI